jgi:hypothetical protein
MAWTAANLFLHGATLPGALEALAPLLADPEQQADREGLLGAPEPFLVGPSCDGWLPVIGLRGWVADLAAFAKRLSATGCAERVVSSEMLGGCYRLRHTECRGGAQLEQCVSPEGDWGRCGSAVDAPMPLFRDVEQLAYAMLLDLGVPPAAMLIGTCPLDRSADDRVLLGEGLRVERRDGALQRTPVEVRAIPYAGNDAPVLPREVGRDFGLALFDDRFVDGVPTEAAVSRLLQIEELIRARACRLYGAELTLTMLYHSGGFQDDLDALLRARGCSVPVRAARSASVPWWQFWRYLGRWR